MPTNTRGESDTELWVDVDLYVSGECVERLTFKEGDDYGAEVHTDDFRLEVVGFREVMDS